MNRLLLVLTLLLSACQILPDLSRRSVSTHLDLPASPQLQNALLPAESAPASGKLSDIYLLGDGCNASLVLASVAFFLASVALLPFTGVFPRELPVPFFGAVSG